MRHRAKRDSLNRFSSFRKATIKSLITSVLMRQRIITTKNKAKSARRAVEKIITLGKKGTLSAKRRAFSILCDHKLVKVLFDKIAPVFSNRTGGYTRIISYGYRRGDNAQMAILELTQTYKEDKKKPAKEVKIEKPPEVKEQKQEAAKAEKVVKVKPEIKKEEEVKKEKSVKTEIKEEKEPLKQEEKPHAHLEEEKHKRQKEKKPEKFFKGFKGFFKRKRDSL